MTESQGSDDLLAPSFSEGMSQSQPYGGPSVTGRSPLSWLGQQWQSCSEDRTPRNTLSWALLFQEHRLRLEVLRLWEESSHLGRCLV